MQRAAGKILQMLKEEILARKLILEESKNCLITSVYIKIVYSFGAGFGWDPWEHGDLFVGT